MFTRVPLRLVMITSWFLGACGGVAATSPADAGADALSPGDALLPAPDSSVSGPDAAPRPPPAPNAVVLFAGDGPALLKDTWEWDGTAWSEKKVSGPPTRYEHRLASLGGKVVLFGGEVGAQQYGDTWEWDGVAWTEKKIPGPSPRSRHGMATVGNKIVVYGGMAVGHGQLLDDTWEYDGTAWTQKQIPGPHALHPIVMSALGSKVVLFDGSRSQPLTWEYDGTSWTSKQLIGPSSRMASSMAELGGKIVLFGGEIDSNHFPNDTWEYDGVAWTQKNVKGPGARLNQAMTTFSLGHQRPVLVLFGGENEPVGTNPPWLNDTWIWDGSSWTASASLGPGGRDVYTLAAR